jgi:glucosamine kinase
LPGYLGLDVGGSATRWRLAGERETEGTATGFSGHLSKPDVLAQAERALAEIAATVGPVATVVAGVTGLSAGTPEAETLDRLIRQRLGATHTLIMSDIELAARTAFPPGEGILVYAGTGSIAAHLAADGTLHTAGGKGVLIDDAGGGYWIAVRALRAVLRAEDGEPGSGWATPLGRALAERLGGTAWPTVRVRFYGLDRGGIAMLALAAGEAARAGDEAALGVLADAGRELALLAQMLTKRLGPGKVILSGRASGLHPALLDSMQSALPGLSVTRKALDAALHAAKLARSLHDFDRS